MSNQSGFLYVYVKPEDAEKVYGALARRGFKPQVLVYAPCWFEDFQDVFEEVLDVANKPPRFMKSEGGVRFERNGKV
ncbi:MAG: hypothetical protein QXS54_12225 [Candidatus Methanomethylicaceae archaeon]